MQMDGIATSLYEHVAIRSSVHHPRNYITDRSSVIATSSIIFGSGRSRGELRHRKHSYGDAEKETSVKLEVHCENARYVFRGVLWDDQQSRMRLEFIRLQTVRAITATHIVRTEFPPYT